jgi:tRNA 2-thiouridine synthesizing protein A
MNLVPVTEARMNDNRPANCDANIDITGEICPMTFVRTRLALDGMQSGQILKVRLRGDEPLRNVPRSAVALGHRELHRETDAEGATLIWFLRA